MVRNAKLLCKSLQVAKPDSEISDRAEKFYPEFILKRFIYWSTVVISAVLW